MHLLDARRRHAREHRLGEASKAEEKKNDEQEAGGGAVAAPTAPGLTEEHLIKPIEETYSDKALKKTLKVLSTPSYDRRLADANAASKLIGNTVSSIRVDLHPNCA